MSTPPTHPRIPYGEADFRRIRLNRWLYVDKTRFLRRLEEERYVFLSRPRRFGKSNYGILDRGLRGALDLFGVWWLKRRRKAMPVVEEVRYD